MKIVVEKSMVGSGPVKIYIHQGDQQPIEFVANTFGKVLVEGSGAFSEINQYLELLGTDVPNKMFEIYKAARYDLENIWSITELSSALQKHIKDLSEFINLNDIRDWIAYRSNVYIPDGFATEYTKEMDEKGSRAQTYLRDDYIQLLALSVAIRLLIPIWGEFINKTKKEVGTSFKEYYAFRLLKDSSLFWCEPMKKLRLYIQNALESDPDIGSLLLGGVSSQEIPAMLLSQVVIRSVATGSLEKNEEITGNLITSVYKYITNKINQGWRQKAADKIKPKEVPTGHEEGEEKISSIERYKIKFKLAPGIIVEFEHVLENHQRIVDVLAPGMDMNLIKEAEKSLIHLQDHPLQLSQVTLMSWVYSEYITPKAFMYVSRDIVLTNLALCQAILWHHGFKFLSILLASYVYVVPEHEMVVSSMESRERVPKDLAAQADQQFPFARQSGRKSKQAKSLNSAINSANLLIDQFASKSMITVASDYFLNDYYGSALNRSIIIPTDIRTELVKLILFLTERKKESILAKRRHEVNNV